MEGDFWQHLQKSNFGQVFTKDYHISLYSYSHHIIVASYSPHPVIVELYIYFTYGHTPRFCTKFVIKSMIMQCNMVIFKQVSKLQIHILLNFLMKSV